MPGDASITKGERSIIVALALETISITGLSLHRMPSTGPDEGAAELE
jgi:hypothetical protein